MVVSGWTACVHLHLVIIGLEHFTISATYLIGRLIRGRNRNLPRRVDVLHWACVSKPVGTGKPQGYEHRHDILRQDIFMNLMSCLIIMACTLYFVTLKK